MTPPNDEKNPFATDERSESSDALLMKLYVEAGLPLDYLAYTEDFESLFENFSNTHPGWNRRDVFRRILSLRKQGKLPRLVRPPSPHAKLDTEVDTD